jgi:hypothetical protein
VPAALGPGKSKEPNLAARPVQPGPDASLTVPHVLQVPVYEVARHCPNPMLPSLPHPLCRGTDGTALPCAAGCDAGRAPPPFYALAWIFQMPNLVSWSDVFAIGIGFDIAGAYLLAKGLLMSDEQVLGLARTYWDGSPDQVVARVDDRIAGATGLVGLVAGFIFQLAGYFISSSIAEVSQATSFMRGVATVVFAIGAIAVVAIAYVIARPGQRRRLLIRLARYDQHSRLQPLPYGFYLLTFGRAARMPPPRDGESQADYAKRVWRVPAIIEGGPRD